MRYVKILLAAGALLVSSVAITYAVAQSADALQAACNASGDIPNDQCSVLSSDAQDVLGPDQIAYLTAIVSGDDLAADEASLALSADDQNDVVQFFVEFNQDL